jgi:hypothetical protein
MKVDRSLWQRLESFTFDDEFPEHSFADRLARENGWSEAYTERVLNEYQRFLYLSQVADHPVTPSEAVDQAWHLHLIYTRSYWGVLCATVLDRPLHHGPSRGGPEEDERYREQYAATLRSYCLAFGDPPESLAEKWVGRPRQDVIPLLCNQQGGCHALDACRPPAV